MSPLTYDAGALIAAERGSADLWKLHRKALAHGRRPRLPTAVLAQVWHGGTQARLAGLLRGCEIEPLGELQARAAGAALAASRRHDVVDAIVVVSALAHGNMVVTSDPDDLRAIAEALGHRLPLQVI